jgi:hypothetical protein
MGKIYSCYNTLRLESQQVGTLLSVIRYGVRCHPLFGLPLSGPHKPIAGVVLELVVGPMAGEDSRAYENLSLDPKN